MDEPRTVYTVFIDLVKFSTEPDDQKLCNTLKALYLLIAQLFDEYRKQFEMELFPTGDGCLLVFYFHTNRRGGMRSGECAKTVLQFAIDLQGRVRSELEDHPIRMGVNAGSALRYEYADPEQKRHRNYTGLTINDGQRIMDFGGDWHILVAESVFEELPSGQEGFERTSEDNFSFKRRDTESGRITLKAYTYPYVDKHSRPHKVANLQINSETKVIIGNPHDPPFTKRPCVLEEEHVKSFLDLLNRSRQFLSVTCLGAEEWFGDDSLLHVLIAQAAHVSLRRQKKPPRTQWPFQRIIIWDEEQQNSPRRHNFFEFHKTGGIAAFLTPESEAQKVVSQAAMKSLAEELEATKTLANVPWKDFLRHPYRKEFWISLGSNANVLDAGFGRRRVSDGGFGLVPLPEQAYDYAKKVFDELQKACTLKV